MLARRPGTEALVLEMGMRGANQIAELAEIAEPDVGVITNVGPVHVELLGSVQAVAAAKAELIDGLPDGGTSVVPADAGLLEDHVGPAREAAALRRGRRCRGGRGDRQRRSHQRAGPHPRGRAALRFPFTQAHNLDNALAAIAAGVALDQPLAEMAERAPGIEFSGLRGELVQLPGGAILINDCYNANPVSMGAALDDLASRDVSGRRIAVLGDMRELGSPSASFIARPARRPAPTASSC